MSSRYPVGSPKEIAEDRRLRAAHDRETERLDRVIASLRRVWIATTISVLCEALLLIFFPGP